MGRNTVAFQCWTKALRVPALPWALANSTAGRSAALALFSREMMSNSAGKRALPVGNLLQCGVLWGLGIKTDPHGAALPNSERFCQLYYYLLVFHNCWVLLPVHLVLSPQKLLLLLRPMRVAFAYCCLLTLLSLWCIKRCSCMSSACSIALHVCLTA